jgi:hypothetical protein
MNWTWEVTGSISDVDLALDLEQGWSDQDSAEQWLREMFADLLDDGVDEVTLVCDGEEIYSMSLEP